MFCVHLKHFKPEDFQRAFTAKLLGTKLKNVLVECAINTLGLSMDERLEVTIIWLTQRHSREASAWGKLAC